MVFLTVGAFTIANQGSLPLGACFAVDLALLLNAALSLSNSMMVGSDLFETFPFAREIRNP
jgi:hypothetical protein